MKTLFLLISTIITAIIFTGCADIEETALSCKKPYPFNIDIKGVVGLERVSYTLKNKKNETIKRFYSFHRGLSSVNISFYGSEYDIDNPKYFKYNYCSYTKLPDDLRTLIDAKGYINSLYESTSSDTVFTSSCNEEEYSIQSEDIISSKIFNVNHCTYISENKVYKYETFVTQDDPKPISGLLEYKGYENDIQNISMKLISWSNN